MGYKEFLLSPITRLDDFVSNYLIQRHKEKVCLLCTFIFLGEGGNLVFLSIKCGYKKVSTSSLFNVQHSCLRP
jgi:hypothetical protein